MTSVTKFLGTRISITSRKSLIRYEGTFYAIDRIEKTIYIIDGMSIYGYISTSVTACIILA